MGNVYINFYFAVIYLCLLVVTQYIFLSVLQFNGYSYRKFLSGRLDVCKRNFLVYILFLFLLVFSLIVNRYFNEFIIGFYIIIQSVLLLVYYAKQFVFCSLSFTKRVARLSVALFVFDLIVVGLFVYFSSIKFADVFTCLMVLVSFGIFSLSFCMLLPIEKLIGKSYISKAKTILDNHKNLIKIGITGSYGKTSVKEILGAILSQNYNVLITPKSYNTPYGITKTINNSLDNSVEVFVAEMGAKKKGEILELCNIVNIDIGIVTSVGHQHTDTFGNIENIYNTKKELSDFLRNKICVFNLMNVYTRKMYFNYVGRGIGCFICCNNGLKVEGKSFKKAISCFKVSNWLGCKIFYIYPHKNNYYAKIKKITEFGSDFDVYYSNNKVGTITTTLLGNHNVINILLSIALAMELGVPFYKIQKSIITLKSISARLEKFVTNKGAVVINNGYNSNINSARSSLGVLNLFENRIKVVITPGLIETSDDFTYNRILGEMISQIADEVIIVKEKNKNAIMSGLSGKCFDMSKVYFVNSFFDAKGVIDIAGENYVFLIENDLPNYYK